jgi:hypothetical protein
MRGRDILLSSMVFCSGFSRSLIYKSLIVDNLLQEVFEDLVP